MVLISLVIFSFLFGFIGLYSLVFGFLASVPMIYHVSPISECLLFSTVARSGKLFYGHYASKYMKVQFLRRGTTFYCVYCVCHEKWYFFLVKWQNWSTIWFGKWGEFNDDFHAWVFWEITAKVLCANRIAYYIFSLLMNITLTIIPHTYCTFC